MEIITQVRVKNYQENKKCFEFALMEVRDMLNGEIEKCKIADEYSGKFWGDD